MDFYSDFHNCQLDLMQNIKIIEDEISGLEKTYADEKELYRNLEKELNSVELDLSYETVRSLKVSSCKDEVTRSICEFEDSIKEEKSRLLSIQDKTAGTKYRVEKECQNVEERAQHMMQYFAQKDASRKIFELEEIHSTEENRLAKLAGNFQNFIMEISKLKRKKADVSAECNAGIVDVAGTVLKLKQMKFRQIKSPYLKQSTSTVNSQSLSTKVNASSFNSTRTRKIENRTESFLERFKAQAQSQAKLSSKLLSFSPASSARKPLFSVKQLPLRSPLVQGQSTLQIKEVQAQAPTIQKSMLPPKQLQTPVKQTQQIMLSPRNLQTMLPPKQLRAPAPVKQVQQTMLPPKQLRAPAPVKQVQQAILSPKQLRAPASVKQVQQAILSPKQLPKPLLRHQNQKKDEVNISQEPKDANAVTKTFELPLLSNQQSSINIASDDIFSSKPAENSGSFGGGFSFLTNTGTDDIDSFFGGAGGSSGFLGFKL